MNRQFNSLFEVNLEPELTQVDCYGMAFGIFCHFSISSNLIESTGDFAKAKNKAKKSDGNYRKKSYHMLRIISI